jgi:hypothetical protein
MTPTPAPVPALSPGVLALARRAVRALLRYQIAVLLDGTRPGRILLDYDEGQALLAAAAHCPDLDLSPTDLDESIDLGGWHAPRGEALPELAWHHPT